MSSAEIFTQHAIKEIYHGKYPKILYTKVSNQMA